MYIDNSAVKEGGLFALENNAFVQLNNVVAINSSAGLVGGVAVLMEDNVIESFNKSIFERSRSRVGGCFTVFTMSYLNISNAIFSEGEAGYGAILYISNCIYYSELMYAEIIKSQTAFGSLIQVENGFMRLKQLRF